MGRSEVGRWALETRIGRGGMGEVWAASDPKTGERAAIKLVRDSLSQTARRRLERESAALAKLDHPAIVGFIETGVAGDGETYLAMELLEGETLSEMVRRDGPLAPAFVARIGADVAFAVAAAHDKGVVHRDLKPSNLVLDPEGVIRIVDFGLALTDDALDPERLTGVDATVGTPSYMSPEQAEGLGEIGPATDIWSLCATLYRLTSGRPPFWVGRRNPLAAMMRILTDEADPLPAGVPQQLADVIASGLAKAPRDRPRTIAELGRRLLELEGQLVGEVPAPEAEVQPVERRLVSVLVADGVAAEAAADSFIEAARAKGGKASRVRGGRIVATFGGSRWLGDEPERAVRAALDAAPTSLAIGVGTGLAEVAVGGGGTVSGEALARALTALADARETSATAMTVADLSTSASLWEELEPEEPYRAEVSVCPQTAALVATTFKVKQARVLGERMVVRTRIAIGRSSDFCGRGEELAQLEALARHAITERSAQMVEIAGPPGIGKTRLTTELVARLRAGSDRWRVLHTRAESTTASWALWRQLIRRQAGLGHERVGDYKQGIEKLCVRLGRLPERVIDPLLRLVASVEESSADLSLPDDPRIFADRLKIALIELFEGWLGQGAVILVVDDTHSADRGSLNGLLELVQVMRDRQLFVIGTTRSPGILGERAACLELGALSGSESAELVQNLIGPDEAVDQIIERAEGNPLFVEELALAVGSGATLDDLSVGLVGAIQARLDQLSAEAGGLVRRASVHGRNFWVEAIGAEQVPLAELAHRGLAAPLPVSTVSGATEWSFAHGLIPEVARQLMTAEELVAAELDAGRWLATHRRNEPERVAAHFDAGGEGATAARWWTRAMEQAERRGDVDGVLALSDRVLAREDDPSRALSIRVRRIAVLAHAGRPEALDQELDLAEEVSGASRDRRDLAKLHRHRAQRLAASGDTEQAEERGQASVLLARSTGDEALAAAALSVLSGVIVWTGRTAEARLLAEQAVSSARRSRDPLAEAKALSALAICDWDDWEGALGFYREALALRRAGDDPRGVAFTIFNVGATLAGLGALAEARDHLREAGHLAHRLGLAAIEADAAANLAIVLHWLGEPDEAALAAEIAVAKTQTLDEPRSLSAALCYRALIRSDAGDLDGALDDVADAVEVVRTIGWTSSEVIAQIVRSTILLSAGRPQAALDVCEVVDGLVGDDAIEDFEFDLDVSRVRALFALGERERARRALSAAVARLEERAAVLDKYRSSFLSAIPSHAALLALAAEQP